MCLLSLLLQCCSHKGVVIKYWLICGKDLVSRWCDWIFCVKSFFFFFNWFHPLIMTFNYLTIVQPTQTKAIGQHRRPTQIPNKQPSVTHFHIHHLTFFFQCRKWIRKGNPSCIAIWFIRIYIKLGWTAFQHMVYCINNDICTKKEKRKKDFVGKKKLLFCHHFNQWKLWYAYALLM